MINEFCNGNKIHLNIQGYFAHHEKKFAVSQINYKDKREM